ncbi:hypothetical protein GWI33_016939 [Rhynchophorus ferrugineus]|uniref:Uncharacterized protein n=1 Tax=Rhynchophorus ferrugineus TaxID=354439 RepID=A0A834I0X0_RHYFE|nr:hypothetical protein GWI33_016939 [Rhynchophorus ferrugineus]
MKKKTGIYIKDAVFVPEPYLSVPAGDIPNQLSGNVYCTVKFLSKTVVISAQFRPDASPLAPSGGRWRRFREHGQIHDRQCLALVRDDLLQPARLSDLGIFGFYAALIPEKNSIGA